jgi:hypothetical protein
MTTRMAIGVRFIPQCGSPVTLTVGLALSVGDCAVWRGLAAS